MPSIASPNPPTLLAITGMPRDIASRIMRDLASAHRVSEALEAGTVCVNHGAVNTNYGPYAGWKESGLGMELSRRGVFEYLKTKHIKVQL